MEKKFVYIVNVENVWHNHGQENHRDCKNYKAFDSENKANDFMLKVWERAKKEKQATFETKIDAFGVVYAEIFFNAGYDGIADQDTFTTIRVDRIEIDNSISNDAFQEIMNEIYIG